MIDIYSHQDRIAVKFPYDPELVAKIQKIPGSMWDKFYKVWTVPATIEAYKNLKKLTGTSCKEIEQSSKRQIICLKNYKFKTAPFSHQIEGIKFILNHFNVEVK